MKIKLLSVLLLLTAFVLPGQVTNGLVANYSFNNGNANDDAGVTNGTVTAAVLTADRFGNANKAYLFNGSSYIDCGNSTAISTLTTAYSISAWFKRSTTAPNYEVIAAKWNTTPASEHFFLATSGSNVAWASAGPGNSGTNDPTVINFNTWVHVVFTWSSTGNHKVYVNNVLTTNVSLSNYTINVTTPVNFMIGAQSAASRFFNGSIDDVKIYNRVLTATEVGSLYNEANPLTAKIHENALSAEQITVFPNPTSEKIYLNRAADVKIMDLQGKIIKNVKQAMVIDMAEFEAGMYIVTVLENERVQTLKVVKQ